MHKAVKYMLVLMRLELLIGLGLIAWVLWLEFGQ